MLMQESSPVPQFPRSGWLGEELPVLTVAVVVHMLSESGWKVTA
jgi:hypothetical protein